MERYLTVDEVLAHTMTVLKGATEEDKLFMRAWITACQRELGPNSNWTKVARIINNEGILRKPEDMTALISIVLYDNTGKELNHTYQTGAYRIRPDRFQVHDPDQQDQVSYRIDLSEDAHYYTIGTNGGNVAYALIRYFAMPVDREGLPLIIEDNLLAFVMYCRWMWSMRQNNNQSEIDQNYRMWGIHMDRVKGRNKMPDQHLAQQIAKSWLNLLTTPKEPNF